MGCVVVASSCARSTPSYDLIVRGGQIVDGTGAPQFSGDIGIRDGRIVTIGPLANETGRRIVDASGMVVAPGFIDLHTHFEDTLPVDGNAESQVRQGGTLVLLGEGQGSGPLGSDAALESVALNMAVYGAEVTWKSTEDYFAQLMQKGTSVNVAGYVSVGPGYRDRAAPAQ